MVKELSIKPYEILDELENSLLSASFELNNRIFILFDLPNQRKPQWFNVRKYLQEFINQSEYLLYEFCQMILERDFSIITHYEEFPSCNKE
jgi:hypothetical protein